MIVPGHVVLTAVLSHQRLQAADPDNYRLIGAYTPLWQDLFDPWSSPRSECMELFTPRGPDHRHIYWGYELSLFLRNVLRGELGATQALFAHQYIHLSAPAEELVANATLAISPKLQVGAVKTGEMKMRASRLKKQHYHRGKYIAYAISDLLDAKAIIEQGSLDPDTPLPHEDLLLSLYQSDDDAAAGEEVYENLRKEVAYIHNPHKPDKRWLGDWSMWCYDMLLKRQG